jgi:signal peptidase I
MNTFAQSRHEIELNLGTEVLRASGELRLAALGSSMVPAIFPGDVLTIRTLNTNEILSGEVVLCARGDRFVVHRVVREAQASGEPRWITRGDTLIVDDPPVTDRELLGRVVAIERNGKQWVLRRPLLSERIVRWCVRHSSLYLRFILHTHSRRRRSTQELLAPRVMRARGCA